MNQISRFATTVLVAGGLTMAAAGLAAGTAQAEPGGWPGCDTPSGPCHWCPGDEAPHTGNHITDPVVWDWNVCHTYWYVYPGQGNVANLIWDGDNPPPPPHAPPALISTREQCEQILGFFCPKA
jgi:hypothetical protein